MRKPVLSRSLLLLGVFFISLFLSGAQKKEKPEPGLIIPEKLLDGLKWRCIGPANMGGRIDDFAVVEGNPDIIYAGTASGGSGGPARKEGFSGQRTGGRAG
jgi:hypothetical protein